VLSYHPGVSKPLPQDFCMVNKGSGKDLGWEDELLFLELFAE
jgi:hypothetical protein